jgi:hypothetical protein
MKDKCKTEGCEEPVNAKGLCKRCYSREYQALCKKTGSRIRGRRKKVEEDESWKTSGFFDWANESVYI